MNMSVRIDESIEIVEADLLRKIRDMFLRGMTAAAIAAALALPMSTVDAALKSAPKTLTAPLQQQQQRRVQPAIDPVDVLARTIYAEARGESRLGRLAVASAIYNRANGDASKMIQVVLRPKQFTPWNKGRIPPQGSGEIWNECVKIAHSMIDGTFQPVTTHTHYYNPRMAKPGWAYMPKGQHRKFIQIGSHRFLTAESLSIA